MRTLIVVILLTSSFFGFSQNQDKSLWRDYLPYAEVTQVVKKGSKVYASTPYAMFSYETDDNSLERISKSNKLSDFGVTSITYNSNIDVVVVGFQNGNIDVLTGSETINISAILKSTLVADKNIYHLYPFGNFVYASTGFGIVKIDLTKMEVADTYFVSDDGSQLKVNAVAVDDNYIYAATEMGLRKADVNSTFLADFSQWSLDTSIPNNADAFASVNIFNGNPFVTYKTTPFVGDTLYYFDGSWQTVTGLDGLEIKSVTSNANKLVVTTTGKVFVFDEHFNVVKEIDKEDSVFAMIDSDGVIWQGAAFFEGLIKHDVDGSTQNVFPLGAVYNSAFSMAEVIDGNLWIATGGVNSDKGFPQFIDNGIQHFDGNMWSIYNRANIEAMDVPKATDYLYVTANPQNPNHAVFTNYRTGGMFELKNGKVTRYFEANSSLQLTEDGETYNLGDVKFDNEGNIWVTNSRVANPLSVKTPEGDWQSFFCGSGLLSARFSELTIDTRGYKWMVSPNDFGTIVYNDNGTPLDTSDDEYRQLTSSSGQGNLPNKQVWCITEDLDGQIWMGTEEGLAVIYNPTVIFEGGNYDAAQILIEQDGNVEILLGAERIMAITVDGANRKWVGTFSSGIYCFSPDGLEQVYHFTTENSPLFSNKINDIKINSKLGEVVIATDLGLQAFKAEVSYGSQSFSDIYAYPNPVRPEYSGKIFINGLMRDSDVKITDISGNLVYETTSIGGQAVWDGNDKFGNRVTTGVYLVFVAASDGSQAEVTKILFVK